MTPSLAPLQLVRSVAPYVPAFGIMSVLGAPTAYVCWIAIRIWPIFGAVVTPTLLGGYVAACIPLAVALRQAYPPTVYEALAGVIHRVRKGMVLSLPLAAPGLLLVVVSRWVSPVPSVVLLSGVLDAVALAIGITLLPRVLLVGLSTSGRLRKSWQTAIGGIRSEPLRLLGTAVLFLATSVILAVGGPVAWLLVPALTASLAVYRHQEVLTEDF